MKITEIKRTISGSNYSNISATANLSEGEDPLGVAISLDNQLHRMIDAIERNHSDVFEKKREADSAVSYLKDALEYAEKKREEIPF